jgi:predicted acylesterase/phospholipase RssA
MLAWEMRSFTQQIFALAYLQVFQKEFSFSPNADEKELRIPHAKDIKEQKIIKCLHLLKTFGYEDKNSDVTTDIRKQGKLGLALSGGGFRASLFHIGVLASLAEADELRHVQVISTVSGGSIIGAFYFLKLKFLFETKHDDEITKEDYILIIKEIEKEFLSGVQENLRMRIFSDFASNWKMLTDPHYSRTHRLGELYEEYFYKKEFFDPEKYQAAKVKMAENRFIDSSELDKSIDEIAASYIENYWERVVEKYEENEALLEANEGRIFMQNLFVNPYLKQEETFDFKLDNWKRKNKIPQLVLNATSVNTGHNFQFTASWMGEPPMNILQDVDVKPRLRRMYYTEAPEPYKNFRLGFAVGASSCVPVMFHPMPMRDLYEGIELQLVDGGLHDNQGISSLLEQECNQIFISDASGQLPTEKVTASNELSLFYRSDSILQERLRELQFLDIKSRSNSTQIHNLTSVHLKNDLFNPPVNWKFCEDPPRSLMYGNQIQSNANHLTRYGVLREIQLALAEIRTDLDAFHDKEAYALMYSGYMQMNHGMEKKIGDAASWQFGKIEPYLTRQEKASEIKPLLMASKKIALKILDVNTGIRWVARILVVLIAILLLYAAVVFWNKEILRYSLAVNGLLIIVGIYLIKSFSKHLGMIINIRSEIRRKISVFFIMVFAFVISNLYLSFINPLYNQSGEMRPKKRKVRQRFKGIDAKRYWTSLFPNRKKAS